MVMPKISENAELIGRFVLLQHKQAGATTINEMLEVAREYVKILEDAQAYEQPDTPAAETPKP